MAATDDISHLKSINIRSVEIKKRVLMLTEDVQRFQEHLRGFVNNEVLVVTTNIGIEIYYVSNIDYFSYIKQKTALYLAKNTQNSKLKYRNNNTYEKVRQGFKEAFFTFSKYPQLFLAYVKKLKFVRSQHEHNKIINKALESFLKEAIDHLSKQHVIPHVSKVQNASANSASYKIAPEIIKKLIAEILLKEHSN